jgi:tellurite resistance-related uncharacterized protein
VIILNYVKKIYLILTKLKLEIYKISYIQMFVGKFPTKKMFFPDYAIQNDSKIFFLTNKGLLRKKPKTDKKKIQKFFLNQHILKDKRIFVGLIKNARIISKNANIITEDNYDINEDFSSLGESMNSFENYLILPKLKEINSRVLNISNSENYFHWMFEILPRIYYIKNTGLKTNLYLLPKNKQFQKDSIKALNIPKNKIIDLNEKTHIKVKEVLFSSMPLHAGNEFFLKNLFLRKYAKQKYEKYKKIYVCRGNVKYRKISNEKEVINFLEKKGFTSVTMDGLSVFEQAKIFNSAKVIVAPHGAALTNLVFCKKGTKVIEFFNSDYVNICYSTISNSLELDYNYFVVKKKIFNSKKDYFLDVKIIESMLEL